jgi:uncharacterized membrane protein YgcG
MSRHTVRLYAAALASTLLALDILAVLTAPVRATTLSRSSGPTPGKYIYDTTGLLSSAEVSELETHAAAVHQAGAAVIVYLQVRSASQDQTQQDAAALMNAWDVETAPGRHDGVVMYFNLNPGNLRHGQVAIYAGGGAAAGGGGAGGGF